LTAAKTQCHYIPAIRLRPAGIISEWWPGSDRNSRPASSESALGLSLGDRTPDENTIRHFRNRLTETGTLKRVMKAFDWQLQKKGYIPMSGQIVDASLVPAPKQRNTEGEREAIKSGKSAKDIWPDEPNKAAQKDTDARWTLKIGGKVRHREDGTPLPMIALPVFGYKSVITHPLI
jgi:hypothetical protein